MDRPWPEWLDVSRETFDKLQQFENLVLRWNGTINLISKTSATDLWSRHILDSAQLYFAAKDSDRLWLDMGSGGGFPGLVMAIMGAKDVVLVESDQRKATFLRQAAREMAVPATVIAKRLSDLPPQGATTITARALTALTGLLAYASIHLVVNGQAIFPKGRQLLAELQEAETTWQFDYQLLPSHTEPEAAILVAENIVKR